MSDSPQEVLVARVVREWDLGRTNSLHAAASLRIHSFSDVIWSICFGTLGLLRHLSEYPGDRTDADDLDNDVDEQKDTGGHECC